MDSESHWDSESSSDLITYQRSLEWDAAYWQTPQTFDLSIGSISSKQFLIYQRAKIEKALTDDVSVFIGWLDERDFEQDRRELPLELRYALNSRWSVAGFGMPSLYKAENDVGLALIHRYENWNFRLSALWGDFERKKRTLTGDSWAESPFAATLSATYLPEKKSDFLNVEAHTEPRSQRSKGGVITSELNHDSIFAEGRRTLESGRAVGGRVLLDRAFHSDGLVARERRRYLGQVEYSIPVSSYTLTPGLNAFYREIRIGSDRVLFRELLTSIWLAGAPSNRAWGTRTLSVGYDGTVFDRQDDQEHARNFEHRLNTKIGMKFKHAGELALLLTFDLDEFGGGETWEGGAGQFRLDF